MVTKIISGGQTGADQGGLEAAKALNIPTGGEAPKGFWTEGGADLRLKTEYDLTESPSRDYKVRTRRNVEESDGTVIFAKQVNSAGTRLTIRMCIEMKRPYLVNPTPEEFKKWLDDEVISILNVAGNRESVTPGIQEYTRDWLIENIPRGTV